MFTGLVEGLRDVVEATPSDGGLRLVVDLAASSAGVAPGDSIAVNGCCLTVESLDGTRAVFHAGRETLGLTALGGIAAGSAVNVERSLRLGDRLGGHLVSGHVDGVGEVAAITPERSQTVMTFRLPERLRGRVILKGSIAVDGVSLTITDVVADRVSVALIPHTLEITTLGAKAIGDAVNLESDMIGKWVVAQLAPILDELKKD